jgi:No apical meristem-associated C-terminal domain
LIDAVVVVVAVAVVVVVMSPPVAAAAAAGGGTGASDDDDDSASDGLREKSMMEEDDEEERDNQLHGDDAQTKPAAKKRSRPRGSTDKKPKKKAKESTAPKQRLKFSALEDLMLCRSFRYTSHNPIIGANQTSGKFWDTVKVSFDMVMKKMIESKTKDGTLEEGEVFVNRKSQALLDRFQRKIAKETQKLNGFIRQRNRLNESGKNEADRLKDALEDYKSQNGGIPFQFSHCLRILHGIPKYSFGPPEDSRLESRASIGSRASQDSALDNEDNEGIQVNDVAGSMQARSWERPKGTKAARTLADQTRQMNYWNARKIKVSKQLNKNRIAAMDRLTASTRRLSDVLQFSSWQNAISARVGHFIMLGEEDKARDLLAKTEDQITNLPT